MENRKLEEFNMSNSWFDCDYENVEKILNNKRKESIEFLEKSLKQD